MSTMISTSQEPKFRQAREQLDAQVREIVNWHFDPQNGTPFWLEKAKTLGFDPRKDVKGFDDLKVKSWGEYEPHAVGSLANSLGVSAASEHVISL